MKNLLLILAFTYTKAQTIALNEVDEFTKSKIIQVNCSNDKTWSNSDNIVKGILNNLFLSLKNIEKKESKISLLQLNFQNGANYCINDNTYIILLFNNKETLQLKNKTNLECGQQLTSIYEITKSDIDKFKSLEIDKIRIYLNSTYIELEIQNNEKENIKNTFILFDKTINQNK